MVKQSAVIALLFILPHLYAMELEKSEKVPFLNNKNALVTTQKDVVIDNHRLARYGDFPEKLYLMRHISGLRMSTNLQKKIIRYMIKTDCTTSYQLAVDYQQEIRLLQKKIDRLTAEKDKWPDIKIDIDTCTNTAYGACSGGCCGTVSGLSLEFIAAAINAYAWCCCNVSHSKIIWDMLIWGLPVCACSGCVIGSCCVASGLYDKIKYV